MVTRADLIAQTESVFQFLEPIRAQATALRSNAAALSVGTQFTHNFRTEVLAGAETGLAAVDGFLTGATAIVDALLLAWAEFLDFPETDPVSILDRLYQDFIDNSDTVQRRAINFDIIPTADGGNVGNGNMVVLVQDRENLNFQNLFPNEDFRYEVTSDATSGAERNAVVFEIRGEAPIKNEVEAFDLGAGSGVIQTLTVLGNVIDITNPGFDLLSGTEADPDEITGWDSSVTVNSTNFAFDPTNIFLPKNIDTEVRRSLTLKSTVTLTKKLVDEGISLDPSLPHNIRLHFNREIGSATGTLVIRLGNTSATVAVSAQTGFNSLTLGFFEVAWYENFNKEDLEISIEWTRTAGELKIDDLIFQTGELVDGDFLFVFPGQTPWLRGDKFTRSRSLTSEGKINQFLWRLYDRYLPHTAVPTVDDPT